MTTNDVLLVIGLILGLCWVFRRRRGFTRLRGVKLLPMWRATLIAWWQRRRTHQWIRLGLWLPAKMLAGGSFLIQGASRSGKTVLLNLLRWSLLRWFWDPNESVLVIDFDPKRDNRLWARYLPPDVPYFDLSPSVQGCGLDLFDFRHDGDRVTLAEGLLPEVRNDHQPHFRNTAVLLATSVLRAARWHGHRMTLRRLILLGSDLRDLRRYLRSCPATAPVVTAHLTDGDEAMSVFATLSSGLNRYRTVAAAWEHADRLVTVSEFLDLPKAVLNLPYDDDLVPVLAPIVRLVLLRLEEKILMQNRPGRKICFLLDEFRILRDVRLHLLACKGAEAGVGIVYACQTFTGVKEAHGEAVATELFGLVKNRLFLRADGYDDARYASRSLGQAHGYATLFGKGGWGESSQTVDVAPPEAVMNLPLPSDRDLTVRGFGTTPATGPFRFRLPFRRYLRFLDAAKSAPRLPPRPADHFDLLPLTAAERRELGLR